jgi:hypothetical protein
MAFIDHRQRRCLLKNGFHLLEDERRQQPLPSRVPRGRENPGDKEAAASTRVKYSASTSSSKRH